MVELGLETTFTQMYHDTLYNFEFSGTFKLVHDYNANSSPLYNNFIYSSEYGNSAALPPLHIGIRNVAFS